MSTDLQIEDSQQPIDKEPSMDIEEETPVEELSENLNDNLDENNTNTQNSQDLLDSMLDNILNGKCKNIQSEDNIFTDKDIFSSDTERNKENNSNVTVEQTWVEKMIDNTENLELELEDNVDKSMEESQVVENNSNSQEKSKKLVADKKFSLPLSRVKVIMKTDPDVKIVSSKAAILTAIAAEHFLKFIIKETARVTAANKKKTLMRQHFDEAIRGLDVTEFLEGMMD